MKIGITLVDPLFWFNISIAPPSLGEIYVNLVTNKQKVREPLVMVLFYFKAVYLFIFFIEHCFVSQYTTYYSTANRLVDFLLFQWVLNVFVKMYIYKYIFSLPVLK